MKQAELHPDDRPFRHYSFSHRCVAWISENVFGGVTYTVRRGLLKGLKRRGGLAWLPERAGEAATPELAFWRERNFAGLTVYDVGAFHGLLTLHFARTARQVVAYEPNARNHARLAENLRLNGVTNVTVRKTGVGARAETLTMVSSNLMPGGATVDRDAAAGVRRAGGDVKVEEIPIVPLDEDIARHSLPAPDFVKIDVEGEELAVLRGAQDTLRRHQPSLFLEMHGETMNLKRRNVAALVDCLCDLGYAEIVHVESGARIGQENAAAAAEGHLFCPGSQPGR